jgi:hypothetical protein
VDGAPPPQVRDPVDAELRFDPRVVRLDRFDAPAEPSRDFLRHQSRVRQREHFFFTRREGLETIPRGSGIRADSNRRPPPTQNSGTNVEGTAECRFERGVPLARWVARGSRTPGGERGIKWVSFAITPPRIA